MLETLCLRAVSHLTEHQCVDQYVQCLNDRNVIPKSLDKTRAQVWLASREVPGKRVGEATQAGYWPWNSDAFAELWSFVRAL